VRSTFVSKPRNAAEPANLGGPSESVDHGDSELVLKQLTRFGPSPALTHWPRQSALDGAGAADLIALGLFPLRL
jgi:hypothetical protein